MASGLFVGGRYDPKTNTVTTIAISNLTYYYCGSDYNFSVGTLLHLREPHTRTDMPLAAPVSLAFWSDEDEE